MNLSCPRCQTELRPRASQAGQVVACPSCQQSIQLPAAAPPDPVFRLPSEPILRSQREETRWYDSPGRAFLILVAAVFFGSLLAGAVITMVTEIRSRAETEKVRKLIEQLR